MIRKAKSEGPKTVRCAIYTRKSTEEGLEQEFNSLDAQREAGEAYIKSQQHEGWICLPDRYDDGGFTGGNMERPGLRQLIADIEAKRIDAVVVYKVDRLSRSLLDFARMMESFDRNRVSFVSVTQQFNTATSMGRLVLNVLLSFAQFEREMISERTRDKIAATRRKGKWSGGMPILGYNVVDTKLVVDEVEAAQVRAIFDHYLESRSLIDTANELNRRGWTTKTWTTKRQTVRGGREFTKTSLYQLLRNVVYAGRVRYKTEVHPGEHPAIVDLDVFEKVQEQLGDRGLGRATRERNKYAALLKGLLFCGSCHCAMTPSHAMRRNRRYRYYTCTRAQKRGWTSCPAPSIRAADVERVVVDEIKAIGRHPELVAATLAEVRELRNGQLRRLAEERDALGRQLARDEAELRGLALAPGEPQRRAMAAALERTAAAERRLAEIEREVRELAGQEVDDGAIAAALAEFDAVWDALEPREQVRVVNLLVERIAYDGADDSVSITIRSTGITGLGAELAGREECVA